MTNEHRILDASTCPPATLDEVAAAWLQRGAVTDPDEARRRLATIVLVALDEHDEVAGDASAYLAHQEQLRHTLWHGRVFVTTDAERHGLGTELAGALSDLLARRHATGQDTRAPGIVFEVENAALRRRDPAIWPRTQAVFVGVTRRNLPLRVRYFDGAHAPPPTGHDVGLQGVDAP